MNQPSASAEVFRGMYVEAIPFRLETAVASKDVAAVDDLELQGQAAAQRDETIREGFARGHEEGFRRGQEAGREEGLRQGLSAAESRTAAAVEHAVAEAARGLSGEQARVTELLQKLHAAFDACVSAAEDEMVALCYQVICSVLGEHAFEDAVLRSHVAHALQAHRLPGNLVIHVHPQDAELLAACLCADAASTSASIRCIADAEVALGGFIVHAPGGGLDARLETALLACKEALLAARRQQIAPLPTGARG